MQLVKFVVALVASAWSASAERRCFDENFLFGTATSVFQTEGGLNLTGRTPSIWDDKCLEIPSMDCVNSASDFIHRYKSDIDLMAGLGLSSFRFSVSWSRVMTWDSATRLTKPNPAGLAFYRDLIDTLIAKNIVRVLAIFHGDLPLALKTELSPPSWENTEIGFKVDFWATFNEPLSVIYFENTPDLVYIAAHHLLLSHGHAVKRFRELRTQGTVSAAARISIVLSSEFSYPLDLSSAADVAAAQRRMDFMFGWFLSPITTGEYPSTMRQRGGSRLPSFSTEEAALLKGSYDLFMLNHYSSRNVSDCASPHSKANCSTLAEGWDRDLGIDASGFFIDGSWRSSTDVDGAYLCADAAAYPPGYLDTIRYMHARDQAAEILLTENGWCGNTTLNNEDQLWYHQSYLEQVYTAVAVEKIPVIGYTVWSLVDNDEWGSFKPRYGLFYVDFPADAGSKHGFVPKPNELTRTPRAAATWYAQVATTKCLDSATPVCADASA